MAMVDGQRLYDLNIEGPASERKKANIYKGKITRIEPSLEAAFVDYGAERHGFLPLKEISPEYFVNSVDSGKKPNIKDVLKEGQDIVVQIDKEERGNKGAALTTFVSLAGRFIVLKPNKDRSGGVSRRIVGEDRDLARRSLNDVEVPDGMSVILRTAGIDRSAEELKWDLDTLMTIWQAILDHVLRQPAPFLLYREDNAVLRSLRDYLTNEIGEILIDDETAYQEAREFIEQVMPHNLKKLKLYTDPVPLFTRFQIESQIESAFAHSVTLPSGGSIVIDHTEALVSIDINSARATKGGDIEATALNTNLEAADEIARQLRIRDLGGLVVIDFIDMGPQKHQREVENRLREHVRQDRARVQIGKITRFGLLEMSRQRLRPSIGESAYQTCPRCSGFGTIRSIESLALAILRIVGEEARKERTAKVIAQLPVEVATYLLNEKRDWVQSLENSNDTRVVLVANPHLETPHYDVRRVRDDQTELPENAGVSYSLAEVDKTAEVPASLEQPRVAEQAAIGVIKPATPAPKRKPSGGFVAWLKGLFATDPSTSGKPSSRRKATRQDRRGASQRGRKRDDQRQPAGRKRSKKKSKKASSAERGKKRKKTARDQDGEGAGRKSSSQSPAPKDTGREDRKRSSRNRRSRGGRRRRRSADRPSTPDSGTTPTSGQTQKGAPAGDRSSNRDRGAAESATESTKPSAPVDAKSNGGAPTPDAKADPRPEPSTSQPAPGTDSKPASAPRDSRPKATEPTQQQADAERPAAKPAKPAKPAKSDKPADAAGSDATAKAADKGRLLPWETTPPVKEPAKPSAGEPAEPK